VLSYPTSYTGPRPRRRCGSRLQRLWWCRLRPIDQK
jgi:hypothetical protein